MALEGKGDDGEEAEASPIPGKEAPAKGKTPLILLPSFPHNYHSSISGGGLMGSQAHPRPLYPKNEKFFFKCD